MSVSGDDELALAARMRALSAFAPAYLHDLKGPLNTIVLRVGVLRGVADESAHRTSLSAIEEQVRRLDERLSDWMTLTAAARAAATDLVALLRQCVALTTPAARTRQCQVRLEHLSGPLDTRADATALGTAVLDILRQAVARAHARGTILITLSQRDAQAWLSIADTHLDAAALSVASVCLAQAGGTCLLTPGGDVEIRFPL